MVPELEGGLLCVFPTHPPLGFLGVVLVCGARGLVVVLFGFVFPLCNFKLTLLKS